MLDLRGLLRRRCILLLMPTSKKRGSYPKFPVCFISLLGGSPSPTRPTASRLRWASFLLPGPPGSGRGRPTPSFPESPRNHAFCPRRPDFRASFRASLYPLARGAGQRLLLPSTPPRWRGPRPAAGGGGHLTQITTLLLATAGLGGFFFFLNQNVLRSIYQSEVV